MKLFNSAPTSTRGLRPKAAGLIAFAQLRSRHFLLIFVLILFQQLMVGGTVYSIATLVSTVAGGGNPWPMLWVTAVLFLLPHLPAYFSRIAEVRWQVAIMAAQADRYTSRFAQRPLEYGNAAVRDSALSATSSEAYIVSHSVVAFTEGLLGGGFNALCTILPILIFVDANYIWAYFVTVVFSAVTFQFFRPQILKRSRAAQESRVALDQSVRESWAHLTIGSVRQRAAATVRLNEALADADHQFAARERSVSAGSSLVGAGALMTVLLITFWLFDAHEGDIAFLSILVATFPRHIQIISQIIGVAELSFSAPRLIEEISNINLDDRPPQSEADAMTRINSGEVTINGSLLTDRTNTISVDTLGRGRHQIEGPNGSGKSTLLALLAARASSRPYAFIPAMPAALATPGTTASSGELMYNLLQNITHDYTIDLVFLDEWDANLDTEARAVLERDIDGLAERATVIEVRHAR